MSRLKSKYNVQVTTPILLILNDLINQNIDLLYISNYLILWVKKFLRKYNFQLGIPCHISHDQCIKLVCIIDNKNF